MDELEKYITDTYLIVLGRPPDPKGLKSWVLQIKSGKIKKEKLVEIFENSYEYTQLHNPVSETEPDIIKKVNKITFVSSWNTKCGIAIYTTDLMTAINNITAQPYMCGVHSLTDKRTVTGELVHLQNELGLMPEPPEVDRNSKVIITWHTVPLNMNSIVGAFENKLNVVAHIVSSEDAAKPIRSCSNKDVHVFPIGSTQISQMDKQHARQLLNIMVNKSVGFVFGFQSSNKKYHEIINAAKNTGIHLIISGAKNDNDNARNMSVASNGDVTFIGRYLSELEVSQYALASDILLFDYLEQKHYSASAAMHRVIGAGRPVICSNIKHFSELTDNNSLKFSSQKELEECINKAIGYENAKLSKGALDYAALTSWPTIAGKHMELYQKYIEFGSKS